jgi:Fur family transcriptional regulator, peroxide stress response regulator
MVQVSTKNRNTAQRKLILEQLKSVKTHPTADQIYEMVRKRMPGIGLATIYRNLDHLLENGLVIKLESKGNKARYDGFIDPHCHLICKDCGAVADIDDVQKVTIKSDKLECCGFQPSYEFLEVFGLCKKCK